MDTKKMHEERKTGAFCLKKNKNINHSYNVNNIYNESMSAL